MLLFFCYLFYNIFIHFRLLAERSKTVVITNKISLVTVLTATTHEPHSVPHVQIKTKNILAKNYYKNSVVYANHILH